MEFTPDKWTEYERRDDAVVLARLHLMSIRPDHSYAVKKSTKWSGGGMAKVLELRENGAFCEVFKMDQRRYSPVRTNLGNFEIPYSSFVSDEW